MAQDIRSEWLWNLKSEYLLVRLSWSRLSFIITSDILCFSLCFSPCILHTDWNTETWCTSRHYYHEYLTMVFFLVQPPKFGFFERLIFWTKNNIRAILSTKWIWSKYRIKCLLISIFNLRTNIVLATSASSWLILVRKRKWPWPLTWLLMRNL